MSLNQLITKASGVEEPFSEEKLRHSLGHARISTGTADHLANHIKAVFKPGMSTTQIYQEAFKFLKKQEPGAAARYNLKRAIMDLGPTGHPFEQFVGELLRAQGYDVQVACQVQGFCVTHEVDVVAERNNTRLMVECKFHNQVVIKCDVKIALYVQARFEDIQKRLHGQEFSAGVKAALPTASAGGTPRQNTPATPLSNDGNRYFATQDFKFDQGWLVTNTKLTSEAVQYSRCVGLHAVGWNYPVEGSLQHLIERTGLHPLTCLTSLSLAQKKQLLSHGLVLCKQLPRRPNLLSTLRLSPASHARLMQEIKALCG